MAEPTDREVLDSFDLDALRQRFVDEGFRVELFPDGHRLAGSTVAVTAIVDSHVDVLENHPFLDTHQLLPVTREMRDWPQRLSEAVVMLRVATGRTHADLGPTNRTEAAFAALS